jgi:hypothetical protein
LKKNNKTKQAKSQEISNKILKNNDGKKYKEDNDATMRIETGEEFDSMDFSPESWKSD